MLKASCMKMQLGNILLQCSMLSGLQLLGIKKEFQKYISTPIDEEIDYVVYIISNRSTKEINFKK